MHEIENQLKLTLFLRSGTIHSQNSSELGKRSIKSEQQANTKLQLW